MESKVLALCLELFQFLTSCFDIRGVASYNTLIFLIYTLGIIIPISQIRYARTIIIEYNITNN